LSTVLKLKVQTETALSGKFTRGLNSVFSTKTTHRPIVYEHIISNHLLCTNRCDNYCNINTKTHTKTMCAQQRICTTHINLIMSNCLAGSIPKIRFGNIDTRIRLYSATNTDNHLSHPRSVAYSINQSIKLFYSVPKS